MDVLVAVPDPAPSRPNKSAFPRQVPLGVTLPRQAGVLEAMDGRKQAYRDVLVAPPD